MIFGMQTGAAKDQTTNLPIDNLPNFLSYSRPYNRLFHFLIM